MFVLSKCGNVSAFSSPLCRHQNEKILEITIDCTCTEQMCRWNVFPIILKAICLAQSLETRTSLTCVIFDTHKLLTSTEISLNRLQSASSLFTFRLIKDKTIECQSIFSFWWSLWRRNDSLKREKFIRLAVTHSLIVFLVNSRSQLYCWNNQMTELYMRHCRFLTLQLSVQQLSMISGKRANAKPVSFNVRPSSMVSKSN